MTVGTVELPLAGITVVSIEQAVAAPFATRQLADLGARVIKVERPGTGDFARGYDETVHGQSSYFAWLNRSKESLTLDIKADAGRAVLDALLARADVFVQNLAPGAAERLGLGTKALAEAHPQLIACNVSGYGSGGPGSDRKAYDLLIQAEAGLLSITGTPEVPSRAGISIADIAAGMYGFSGILTALFRRATTGVVAPVEVALLDALAEWMVQPAYYRTYGDRPLPRSGGSHMTIAPYGPFTCADGDQLVVAVQNDREWQAFATELLDPGTATDPRFARNSDRVANRDVLDALVAERVARMDAATLSRKLDEIGVANAPVGSVEDLFSHPSLVGRDRWRDVAVPGATIRAPLPPADLAGVEPRMDPVPDLGEHTDRILEELGYDPGAIAELRELGVIGRLGGADRS